MPKFQQVEKQRNQRTKDDVVDVRITIGPNSNGEDTKDNITKTFRIKKSKVSAVAAAINEALFTG